MSIVGTTAPFLWSAPKQEPVPAPNWWETYTSIEDLDLVRAEVKYGQEMLMEPVTRADTMMAHFTAENAKPRAIVPGLIRNEALYCVMALLDTKNLLKSFYKYRDDKLGAYKFQFTSLGESHEISCDSLFAEFMLDGEKMTLGCGPWKVGDKYDFTPVWFEKCIAKYFCHADGLSYLALMGQFTPAYLFYLLFGDDEGTEQIIVDDVPEDCVKYYLYNRTSVPMYGLICAARDIPRDRSREYRIILRTSHSEVGDFQVHVWDPTTDSSLAEALSLKVFVKKYSMIYGHTLGRDTCMVELTRMLEEGASFASRTRFDAKEASSSPRLVCIEPPPSFPSIPCLKERFTGRWDLTYGRFHWRGYPTAVESATISRGGYDNDSAIVCVLDAALVRGSLNSFRTCCEKTNQYGVGLHYFGRWKEVFVDDFLPERMVSRSVYDDDPRIFLLCKAFAVSVGESYLNDSNPELAFHLFLGQSNVWWVWVPPRMSEAVVEFISSRIRKRELIVLYGFPLGEVNERGMQRYRYYQLIDASDGFVFLRSPYQGSLESEFGCLLSRLARSVKCEYNPQQQSLKLSADALHMLNYRSSDGVDVKGKLVWGEHLVNPNIPSVCASVRNRLQLQTRVAFSARV